MHWYRRAAEQALEGNDFGAAIARADSGLACGAEGEARGALRLVQAEAHGWAGDLAADEAAALEALSLAPRGGALWCAAAGVAAVASGRLGNIDALLEVGDQVRELCEGETVEAPQVIAAARVALRLLLAGRYDAAERLLAAVEVPASELAERRSRGGGPDPPGKRVARDIRGRRWRAPEAARGGGDGARSARRPP